jgi:prophage tail gpP-like protein
MSSDPNVTVLIAGTEYTDIKSDAIDSNVLTLADAFQIELASADGARSNDSVHGVHGPFYISARRFMRSLGGGTTTVLTFRKPGLLAA